MPREHVGLNPVKIVASEECLAGLIELRAAAKPSRISLFVSINIYKDSYFLVPNYKNSSLHIFDMSGKELKIVGGKGTEYG